MAGIDEYREQRIKKMEQLKEKGMNPYPYKFDISHTSSDIFENQEKLIQDKTEVSIAGRIMLMRRQGKTTFIKIKDRKGLIQLYITINLLGDEYENVKLLDIGDIIGVKGEVFVTHRGETTVAVKKMEVLAKSLLPLPEKYHGIQDVELKYRKRYLDLIMNDDTRHTFLLRRNIIKFIRDYLDQRDFVEVETPVLQPRYGGAFAKPFLTHHNALDMDLYLRISDELYLKRLIVGGLERVYEIARDFRNEGIDKTHNPEFTMIEIYQAYADYYDMMDLVQNLIQEMAKKILGKTKIEYSGHEIELNGNWERIDYYEAIKKFANIDVRKMDDDELKKFCDEHEIDIEGKIGRGKIIDEIFSEMVEKNIKNPTFVINQPKEISPLAKIHRDDETKVERFELLILGTEYANAFSELNDPIDQRKRFEYQMELRKEGEMEVQEIDEDYLEAMEYGMPPTGGIGIGIDRLVMLLTNRETIKDVILFPLLKAR